jgi:uncharacterized membrane protein YfcA
VSAALRSLTAGVFFIGTSAWMLLPALVGMQAGQALRLKLSPIVFRKCFMGSLIALGLHRVVRELM